MSKNIRFYCYRLKWNVRKFMGRVYYKLKIKRPTRKYCAGKKLMPYEEASAFIADNIRGGKPFACCRLGGTEMNAFWPWDSPIPFKEENKIQRMNNLCKLSGFFPPDVSLIDRFAEVMRSSFPNVDIFAVWFSEMEDYAIDVYGNPQKITHFLSLEPWYGEKGWTEALAGKKVLVIHPFKESILKQYQKRELLFENPNILPEFAELHVVKAVQTLAGTKDERFQNWFEALEWMYSEAMKTDFDVAILGCGAYGFPLASKLKEAGKQAVVMGGATQLLFGIKGNRWENIPEISKLFNEHWVYPAESERLANAKAVENACYW